MRVDVNADTAVAFARLMTFAADLRHGLGYRVSQIMRADLADQFAAGGIDPAWPPLAPSTVTAKARMGYPRLTRFGTVPQTLVQRGQFGPQNILIRTGALLSSWTQEQDPDHVERVTETDVMVGSSVPYAGYHQSGGGHLPKRALGITKAAQELIAAVTAKYVIGKEQTT